MVEHTHRQPMQFICIFPTHGLGPKYLIRLVKGPVVQVDDAQLLAQGLGELGASLDIPLEGAKWLVCLRIGLDRRLVQVLKPKLAKLGIGSRRGVRKRRRCARLLVGIGAGGR